MFKGGSTDDALISLRDSSNALKHVSSSKIHSEELSGIAEKLGKDMGEKLGPAGLIGAKLDRMGVIFISARRASFVDTVQSCKLRCQGTQNGTSWAADAAADYDDDEMMNAYFARKLGDFDGPGLEADINRMLEASAIYSTG